MSLESPLMALPHRSISSEGVDPMATEILRQMSVDKDFMAKLAGSLSDTGTLTSLNVLLTMSAQTNHMTFEDGKIH